MSYIIYTFPQLDEYDKIKIKKFPRTPDELRDFVEVIKKYSSTHHYHVLTLFIWIYLLY